MVKMYEDFCNKRNDEALFEFLKPHISNIVDEVSIRSLFKDVLEIDNDITDLIRILDLVVRDGKFLNCSISNLDGLTSRMVKLLWGLRYEFVLFREFNIENDKDFDFILEEEKEDTGEEESVGEGEDIDEKCDVEEDTKEEDITEEEGDLGKEENTEEDEEEDEVGSVIEEDNSIEEDIVVSEEEDKEEDNKETKEKSIRKAINNKCFISYRREKDDISGKKITPEVVINFEKKYITDVYDSTFTAFIDIKDMPAGKFPESIKNEIKESNFLITILTEQYISEVGTRNTDFCIEEIRTALDNDMIIIPIAMYDKAKLINDINNKGNDILKKLLEFDVVHIDDNVKINSQIFRLVKIDPKLSLQSIKDNYTGYTFEGNNYGPGCKTIGEGNLVGMWYGTFCFGILTYKDNKKVEKGLFINDKLVHGTMKVGAMEFPVNAPFNIIDSSDILIESTKKFDSESFELTYKDGSYYIGNCRERKGRICRDGFGILSNSKINLDNCANYSVGIWKDDTLDLGKEVKGNVACYRIKRTANKFVMLFEERCPNSILYINEEEPFDNTNYIIEKVYEGGNKYNLKVSNNYVLTILRNLSKFYLIPLDSIFIGDSMYTMEVYLKDNNVLDSEKEIIIKGDNSLKVTIDKNNDKLVINSNKDSYSITSEKLEYQIDGEHNDLDIKYDTVKGAAEILVNTNSKCNEKAKLTLFENKVVVDISDGLQIVLDKFTYYLKPYLEAAGFKNIKEL